jgi:3-methyladenine DNA glycosylase Tag
MTGSATLTAVPSTKLIAEPRIAAIKTHVFPIGHDIGYDPRTPLLEEGDRIPKPIAKKPARREAPPVKVPARPTPPGRIVRVVANASLDEHLAIVARAVFQAGLSWAMLDAKWPVFQTAFDGFDVVKVAAYGERDVDRIVAVPGMIRSRKKIEGTIRNARALLDLEREFGSVRAYQTSAPYDALRRDIAKRFAYMGDLNAYYWLFRSGAPVPEVEAWMRTQERDHPRIREMVAFERDARG